MSCNYYIHIMSLNEYPFCRTIGKQLEEYPTVYSNFVLIQLCDGTLLSPKVWTIVIRFSERRCDQLFVKNKTSTVTHYNRGR